MSNLKEGAVAEVIRAAGGQIVGRTRLQKIFYLLEVAGYGSGFHFGYKHYGPYSEDLSSAVGLGILTGEVNERQEISQTGRHYSIFTSDRKNSSENPESKTKILSIMKEASSIELELAATAVLLSREGFEADPWGETARRKPEKAAGGRLSRAQTLLEQISAVETPSPIPSLSG